MAGSHVARGLGLMKPSFHLVLDHRSPVGDDELVGLLVHLEELEAEALEREMGREPTVIGRRRGGGGREKL